MSNEAVRRYGGKAVRRFLRCAGVVLLAVVFLTALPPDRVTAQVGHEPSESPFRDITTRQSLTVMGGYFFGNSARAHVGALGGPSLGLRFRSGLSGPIEFAISTAYIKSERYVIDTRLPAATRMSGPVPYDLVSFDVALGLTLTGQKTWKGLAPYFALGMGLVAPTNPTTDPGGYKASMGFSVVPTLGVRARIGTSLSLQFEARDNTIRYEWPLRYFDPVDDQGNPISPPVLNNVSDKQTTHNLTLSAGLSYHFNF